MAFEGPLPSVESQFRRGQKLTGACELGCWVGEHCVA